MDDRQILRFISDSIKLAGNELMRLFAQDTQVSVKADSSFVTEADIASEKIIISKIKEAFPDDIILSEEAGLSSVSREPGRYIWIVDPLDGTTNFANRYPFFCVSCGRGQFLPNGKIDIVAGGIEDPIRKRTYLAGKGLGATCNNKPIRIGKQRELSQSFLVTGFYYNRGERLKKDVERFQKLATHCQSIRRDGAAALDLALVAEGIYDGFWELGLQPWDIAAGAILVTEAGGILTNYGSSPNSFFDIEGEGLVAGHPYTVEQISALL
ncbi:MAG: inositol monophosphatase [Oligoflexales bacterium]